MQQRDRRRSPVLSKPAWVWVALDRTTRQIVTCCLGDRNEESCRYLWEQMPEPWRKATCYTNHWDTYGAVLPLRNTK